MTLAGIISAPPIRTLSTAERQRLRDLVISLHGDGMDPKDIAARVDLHEEWCRRAINRWQAEQLAAGISTERTP